MQYLNTIKTGKRDCRQETATREGNVFYLVGLLRRAYEHDMENFLLQSHWEGLSPMCIVVCNMPCITRPVSQYLNWYTDVQK